MMYYTQQTSAHNVQIMLGGNYVLSVNSHGYEHDPAVKAAVARLVSNPPQPGDVISLPHYMELLPLIPMHDYTDFNDTAPSPARGE